ncbi:hypothetical protein [Chitinasiproducens palmae]|uniref:Uncharacterized protein n=1 Tax=Chitinasiproducens palmae TaxID=1770053 RepID=A0A1H2PQK7_9BURK|nr:hypothetical protein [Chitinasiproducens palmae]SDV49108.1 hypothetical protein SAMN05216551_10776 [Chitinasiproducens palmae]
MKGRLCRPEAGYGIYVAAPDAFPPDPGGSRRFQASWQIFEGVDVRVERLVEEHLEPRRFLSVDDALAYAEDRARAHLHRSRVRLSS